MPWRVLPRGDILGVWGKEVEVCRAKQVRTRSRPPWASWPGDRTVPQWRAVTLTESVGPLWQLPQGGGRGDPEVRGWQWHLEEGHTRD